MEEQNKQSEQETSGAEPKEQGTPTRSSIIMLLAGISSVRMYWMV